MFEARRRQVTVSLSGTAILLSFPAHAIDLTGASASQGDLCKLVFTKRDWGLLSGWALRWPERRLNSIIATVCL
jgi:hypothetical protein